MENRTAEEERKYYEEHVAYWERAWNWSVWRAWLTRPLALIPMLSHIHRDSLDLRDEASYALDEYLHCLDSIKETGQPHRILCVLDRDAGYDGWLPEGDQYSDHQ